MDLCLNDNYLLLTCGNPAPGNPATVTNITLLPTLEEEDEVSS